MKNLIAEYDESNYIFNQINYFKENKKEFLDWREIENTTDEEIEEFFYHKNYDFQIETHTEDFFNSLDEEFHKHIGKKIIVYGKDMTWRNLSGTKDFILEKSRDIIDNVSVNSDFTFKLWKINKNKYEGKLYHHDSPMGETYIYKIKENEND